MAVKTFDAISQSITDNILTVNPSVDIKIGEAVRDLFIDVQAAQLEELYGITDYSSRAQSVLTATGPQLDRLGYNFSQLRSSARRSTGNVTIIMKSGLSAPTLLNTGDQFYTQVDQTGTVHTFILAQTLLLAQGTVQATLPIIALTPGASENVAPYSITQSNYEFVDTVYNIDATSGGVDTELDPAFASRIPTFVTGAYTNTFNGIVRTLFGINNINSSPHIVTPGDPLSRGPYTVDVYLQRLSTYFGTAVEETAPANQARYKFLQQPIYELNPVNQITMFDPSTNTSKTFAPTQYTIYANNADTITLKNGTVRATTYLQWNSTPPSLPYVVNYNVDQTIRDAQAANDALSEVVCDTLYRQAQAVQIFISATVSSRNGATPLQVQQSVTKNAEMAFGSLKIGDFLSPNQVVYSILTDGSISDVQLTNLDSTYEVSLTGNFANGRWNFLVSGPSSNVLFDHPISPLTTYWDDAPPANVFSPFPAAGRLFIGDPTQPSITNLQPSAKGVSAISQIRNISASWAPQVRIDPFYDSVTQTLILDFFGPVTQNSDGSAPTIQFTIVQPNLVPVNALSYLTLAPPLVQPIIAFQGSIATQTPLYGTVLPYGLNGNRAKVYKNAIALTVSLDGVTGDYTIAPPDANGVYSITFLTTPASSDVLQFGLLNPDLTISVQTS